jgi:hypothetical protein
VKFSTSTIEIFDCDQSRLSIMRFLNFIRVKFLRLDLIEADYLSKLAFRIKTGRICQSQNAQPGFFFDISFRKNVAERLF